MNSRSVSSVSLGVVVTAIACAAVVAGVVLTRRPNVDPIPLVNIEGGQTLCGPWQATGESCPGGCMYSRECFVCDDAGCEYAYTVHRCLPSQGPYCPLVEPLPGYAVDAEALDIFGPDGLPLTPDDVPTR